MLHFQKAQPITFLVSFVPAIYKNKQKKPQNPPQNKTPTVPPNSPPSPLNFEINR